MITWVCVCWRWKYIVANSKKRQAEFYLDRNKDGRWNSFVELHIPRRTMLFVFESTVLNHRLEYITVRIGSASVKYVKNVQVSIKFSKTVFSDNTILCLGLIETCTRSKNEADVASWIQKDAETFLMKSLELNQLKLFYCCMWAKLRVIYTEKSH